MTLQFDPFGVAIALTAVLLIGFLVVGWAMDPQLGRIGRRRILAGPALSISLAVGVGLAVWSASYAVVLFTVGAGAPWRIGKDIVLATIGAVGCAWRFRSSTSLLRTVEATSRSQGELGAALLGLCCLLALAGLAHLFSVRYATTPNGSWDAWNIWNQRARFLTRGGEDFETAFSPINDSAHPDYPLLLPGLVAQGWLIAGGESTTIPAACGFAFMVMIIATLVGIVWRMTDSSTGFLAGIVLMGTPCFVKHASSQCADVPLAAYELMACVAFVLACESRTLRGDRLLLLSGLLAGAAAWTKNEGLVFVAALAIAIGLAPGSCAVHLGGRPRRLARYLIGAAPLLILFVFFKWRYAPANDLIEGASQRMVAQCADASRHWAIAGAFVRQCFVFGNWNYYVLVFPLLAAVCVRRKDLPPSLGPLVLLVCLTLLGFYGAYVVTPHVLAWHLVTSLDRLFLQIWPIVVLILFMSFPSTATRSNADERPEPSLPQGPFTV